MSNLDFQTEQEDFWAGQFGTEYINRNKSQQVVASNASFFSRALCRLGQIRSCIEIGANIGLNLTALRILYSGQYNMLLK